MFSTEPVTVDSLIYSFTYILSMSLVLEDSLYSNFINSLRTEKTKKNYDFCLKGYMKFNKTTHYSQLVTLNAYASIKAYNLDMVKRQVSTAYMNVHICALKCFYEMNSLSFGILIAVLGCLFLFTLCQSEHVNAQQPANLTKVIEDKIITDFL